MVVKPDTTIHPSLTRINERKGSRKLQKHLEATDEVDQEEEDCFDGEKKQPRRVKLKRNVTLSTQVCLPIYYFCLKWLLTVIIWLTYQYSTFYPLVYPFDFGNSRKEAVTYCAIGIVIQYCIVVNPKIH